MSVKISGKVWEMNLSSSEKLVLLALADHADHDGNNAYPGLELLAAKTSYSRRNVRRVLLSLEERGVISCIDEGLGAGNFAVYSINSDAVELHPLFRKKADKASGKKRGQSVPFEKSGKENSRSAKTSKKEDSLTSLVRQKKRTI